jgi:hypothetical protein
MKITRSYNPANPSIVEFAEDHDLTLEIHRRHDPSLPRYYAHFASADILDGACPRGTYGDGQTELQAVNHYAARISRRRLVLNVMCASRREITVPQLREIDAMPKEQP